MIIKFWIWISRLKKLVRPRETPNFGSFPEDESLHERQEVTKGKGERQREGKDRDRLRDR